jgi:signal transduction histidine kinase
MKRSGLSETDIDKHLHSIKWAAADYEWEHVKEQTTRLLEEEDLPPQTRVAVLHQRGTALQRLGDVHEAQRDLEAAVSTAEEASLIHEQIDALNDLSFHLSGIMVDQATGLHYANIALELAQQSGSMAQQADSHFSIAHAYMSRSVRDDQFLGQSEHAQRTIALAQQSGNKKAEAGGYEILAGIAAERDNKPAQAEKLFQKSVALYREVGQLDHAGKVHHAATSYNLDLNLKLKHNLQAFRLAREVNNIVAELAAGNNRAFMLWSFGLYHNTEQLALEVVRKTRELNLPVLPTYLSTLVECSLLLGKYDHIPTLIEEMRTHGFDDGFLALLSGMAALGSGDHETAVTHLQEAVPKDGTDRYGMAPTALAWLGAVELNLGDVNDARKHTAEAVSLSDAGQLYTAQEIWWWHYQASCSAAHVEVLAPEGVRGKTAGKGSGFRVAPLTGELFAILDRARREMLDYIAGISDEALRRSYLNKVPINHDISLEWTRQAAARGHSLAPFTERETKAEGFEEQFQRLVEIGNSLTAERDPRMLPDTIRDEFVALSGAERVVVALRDEAGELIWASTLGLADEDEAEDAAFIEPFLNKARALHVPQLFGSEGTVPEGGISELYLRSVMALPLVSQGRLWGVLYGDMRHIFGHFNEQDLALLNLLANQAAAALENADWVEGLEEKVKQRTDELQTANTSLEERNAELAIINTIQAGLVKEIDIQAIYDMVGYKLVDIFPEALSVGIGTIDADEKIIHDVFVVERGKRYRYEPDSYAGTPREPWHEHLANTKEVILVNENTAAHSARFVDEREAILAEGTERPKSILYVPMIIGDQVRGYVSLQDPDREFAFDDADVRLLTTVTNAMSVALENAHLFDETQRLYAVAEQAKQQAEEARQIAEEASEAKSRFLASMSHELRTPLNAIIGFTRIVKRKARGSLPEKQIDNLGKVQSSAEHLLGLINMVLDIAKIEAGRMEVLASEFEVEALVEMCLATAQPLARPGVDMVASVPSDLPTAYSDQDKIRQILLNTLSNAAKFTHKGRITLQVQQQDGLLICEVVDSGIGMNEEQLARVFEEFQQAESTTSRDYGGTGLGLPISKQLAQLLGGDLVATSIEGEGSTFTLSIPIRLP